MQRTRSSSAHRVAATLALACGPSAAALALLAGWQLPADAHTDLTGSNPASGEVIEGPLDQVTLDFASPVSLDLTVVAVSADDAPLEVGRPTVAGATVTVPVRDVVAAGEYVVAYRTVSADGHPITGSFSFEVGRSATRLGAAERTETGTIDGSTGGSALPVMAAVGLATLLGATVMHHRRRPWPDRG